MQRILVVDDDREIRQLLQMVLEAEGYEVATANDGIDALAILLQSDRPWIVLLDITMPRMSGLEVCARLAASGGLATRHRVILMTAGIFPEEDDVPPVRARLRKPFELHALYDLVADVATDRPDEDAHPSSYGPSLAIGTVNALERLIA